MSVSGAAEQGSPGSPRAPLFQDISCHFQKYKAKVSWLKGSKVTVLHAYELYLSPGNEFGGFSDITIQSESDFVIEAREEGSPYLMPQSRALLISLNGAAAEVPSCPSETDNF